MQRKESLKLCRAFGPNREGATHIHTHTDLHEMPNTWPNTETWLRLVYNMFNPKNIKSISKNVWWRYNIDIIPVKIYIEVYPSLFCSLFTLLEIVFHFLTLTTWNRIWENKQLGLQISIYVSITYKLWRNQNAWAIYRWILRRADTSCCR